MGLMGSLATEQKLFSGYGIATEQEQFGLLNASISTCVRMHMCCRGLHRLGAWRSDCFRFYGSVDRGLLSLLHRERDFRLHAV